MDATKEDKLAECPLEKFKSLVEYIKKKLKEIETKNIEKIYPE